MPQVESQYSIAIPPSFLLEDLTILPGGSSVTGDSRGAVDIKAMALTVSGQPEGDERPGPD